MSQHVYLPQVLNAECRHCWDRVWCIFTMLIVLIPHHSSLYMYSLRLIPEMYYYNRGQTLGCERASRRLLNRGVPCHGRLISSHPISSHHELQRRGSRSQVLADNVRDTSLAVKAKPPQHHGDGERDDRPVVLVRAEAVQVALADLGHHQVGVGIHRGRLAALPLAAGTVVAADAQRAAQAVEDVGQRRHELGGDLDGAPAALERVDGRGEVALDLVVDGLRDAREGRVQRGDELAVIGQ